MPIDTSKTYKLVDGVQPDRRDRLAMKGKKRELEEVHRCACCYVVIGYVTASLFLVDALLFMFVWNPAASAHVKNSGWFGERSFQDCKFPSAFCSLVLAALSFLLTYFESRVMFTTLELLDDENFLKSSICVDQHRLTEHLEAETELFKSNKTRVEHLLQSAQGRKWAGLVWFLACILFFCFSGQNQHDPNCGENGPHSFNAPALFNGFSVLFCLFNCFLRICVFFIHKCLPRVEDTDSESE